MNEPDDTERRHSGEVVHVGSVLGWGGVILQSDGLTLPMPDHEAIAGAIPHWVHLPEHVDDAVRICLDVVTRPEAIVRVAAATAFGEIARRYGRLPQEQAVRQAVARALADPDDGVREAATVAKLAIRQALGA